MPIPKLVCYMCLYAVLSLTLNHYVKAQAVYDYDLGRYLSLEQEPNNTSGNPTLLTTYDYDDSEQTLRGVFEMRGNVSEGDEDWFVISMEMTLELVDSKALKFKLNEIEQRY